MHGCGPLDATQRRDVRQTQLGRGSLGQQDGLIEAALPEPLGMDGHRDQQLAADARPAPARRQDGPERPGDAPVACVLQLVEGPSGGAGERRAPLELRKSRRQVGGQSDRPSGIDLDPGAEMAEAVAAQERAFVAATGAGRRHQQVEQPIHERMLELDALLTLAARCTIDRRAPIEGQDAVARSSPRSLPRILRPVTTLGAMTAERRDRGRGVILGGLGVAILLIAGQAMIGGAGTGYDLAAYLAAAARVLAGTTPYQPETLGGPFTPGPAGLYLYAPPLALVLTPLTRLASETATVVWLLLRVVALAAACAILPVRPWIRGATLLVGAVSFPVLFDLNLGNVSILVVALLACGWRWLDRPAGSIALAIAILVRPTLAVVPAWQALRRRWRPIAWTVGALFVVGVATLPFVGGDAYIDYLTVLRNVSDVLGVPRNVDLGSVVAGLGLPQPWPTLAYLVGAGIGVAVIVVASRRDPSAGYVATVGASLLLAPLLWAHYLVGLLLPAALLADRGRRWGLLLPLLGWLPEPLLPLVTVAGALLPLLVARPLVRQRGDLQADPVTDLRL